MVLINTNQGPISLDTPEQVAAAINAGLIDLQQGAAAQKAIAGGPANTPENNPATDASGFAVQPTLPVGIPESQNLGGGQLAVQPTLPVGIPQSQQVDSQTLQQIQTAFLNGTATRQQAEALLAQIGAPDPAAIVQAWAGGSGADKNQVLQQNTAVAGGAKTLNAPPQDTGDAQFQALQQIISGIGTQFIDPAAVRGAIQAIPGIAPADVEAFFSTASKSFPATFGGPDTGGGPITSGTGVGDTGNAGTAGGGNEFFNSGPDVNTGPGNAVFDQNGIPITPGDIRENESLTRTGRRGLFGGFVANQLATANPQVRSAIGRQFDPLSARFVLEQLVNPGNTGGGNFRDFLSGGRAGFNPGQFNAAFNSLGGLFNGNQPAEGLDIGQQSSVQQLGGATGRNIASSFIGSQLNPFLRGNVSDIVGNRFASFGDRNPLANPFGAFLSNRSLSGF